MEVGTTGDAQTVKNCKCLYHASTTGHEPLPEIDLVRFFNPRFDSNMQDNVYAYISEHLSWYSG